MANYLPVLLVSVAANSIPDDSSVSTLPRGQVDYLSHNWEEEDVWRSWRNMTRQKNEIANGVRLENASWRTWWKQRNGLGTVTPETLNWLKDSDVTWLYGPLHTAVEWTPPPKPIPGNRTSALDLSTSSAAIHKPILKHRSISELLTSDLPTSPIFSPTESDDEDNYVSRTEPMQLPNVPRAASTTKRPTLTHTKSDTHITRWGPSRTFRKESPPRIDPRSQLPGAVQADYSSTELDSFFSGLNPGSDGAPAAAPEIAAASVHMKKRHISFNTFVEQCISIEKPKKRPGDDYDVVEKDEEGEEESYLSRSGRYAQGRHPWGYDDGYEEDEEDSDEDEGEAVSLSMWDERYGRSGVAGSDSDSYDDGAEEEEDDDGEEGDDVIEMRRSLYNSQRTKTSARSQSTVSTNSSSSSTSTSTCTSVSTSTASTASTASTSPDGSRRRSSSGRRLSTSTTSTYRPQLHSESSSGSTNQRHHKRTAPPLIRTPTGGTSPPPQPAHVTIAPIAPTILKTGPNGYHGSAAGWAEGFGDEACSDDGLWGGNGGRWWGGGVEKDRKRGDETASEGTSTPVELVYVPPLGSNYSLRAGRTEREQHHIYARERENQRAGSRGRGGAVRHSHSHTHTHVDVMEDHEDGFGNGEKDVYKNRTTLFQVGDDDVDVDADLASTSGTVHIGTPVPTVVLRRSADVDIGQLREDAYDFFGGPDLGEDFPMRRPSSSGRLVSRRSSDQLVAEASRGRNVFTAPSSLGDVERSLSRSRSRSRTPSPAVILSSTSINEAALVLAPSSRSTADQLAAPVPLRRSASISPPSSALLSAPQRGRGSMSHQDLQVPSRGRSATRTSSTSMSDRDRSTGQHSSSIGSLSPDGIDLASVAAAYANGRLDKEVERERERERSRGGGEREMSRGRDRTEKKRLSESLSPDDVQDSLLRVSPASPVLVSPVAVAQVASSSSAPRPSLVGKSAPSSTSSASSSTSSRSTSSSTTIVPSKESPDAIPTEITAPILIADVRKAEEEQRLSHPTPVNSPIISMQPARSSVPTPPSPTYTTKAKVPLALPTPHPAEPSTSYSVSPPRDERPTPASPTSPRSPSSPTRGETTIVEKAVDLVSSAGAFLGLWHHSPVGAS